MSVVYFLLLVGLLVAIHEFGHFIAAKLLDFDVQRFSIGFGRPLIRIRGRHTEYQIAVIPLGGYVRILGEDPGDEIPPDKAARAFNAKSLWRRLIVVFAGPAANLILPIFIYFIFFAGHTALPASVVGDVLEFGPAARAGIEPGDRITAVNGHSVRYWEQIEGYVQSNIGNELKLRIKRGRRTLERFIVPLEQTERSRDGRSSRQGMIGITQAPFVPLVGVIDRSSPAGKAGLVTGDLIISIDGDPIANWTELRRKLSKRPRRTNVVYLRGKSVPGIGHVKLLESHVADLVPELRVTEEGARSVYTGLEPAEMFIASVDPGSPADKAGLKPGDLITTLDGEPVSHWILLDQRLQSRPSHTWTIAWRRRRVEGGESSVADMSAHLNQVRRRDFDEYGGTVERLVFGASSDYQRGVGELVPIRGRFTYAISKAVERTGDTISVMSSGFWSILAGNSPSESVGGPLMMYRAASVSGRKGWETFLLMLALISINLGLINLLPIPMLDGGHIMVFAIEAVRRKPLSLRARERIQLVGLALVGIITILALRNDVIRFILR